MSFAAAVEFGVLPVRLHPFCLLAMKPNLLVLSDSSPAAERARAYAAVPALFDPGHDWVNKLFGGSAIAEVLRHTQVPMLLLATA